MSLNFGKPDNIAAFIKDEDGNWHKLGDVTSMSIEHDHVYNETTLSVDVFGPLFGPDLWEFHPKREIPVFTFNEITSADKICEIRGFAHPSKHDRYKDHLPKRVIVNGQAVVCYWPDGSKTYSCCHDGDEMDVRTGILLNAIKKWMPGGTYWQDVMDDVTVEYQGKKEKLELNFSRPNGDVIGHATIEHRPCRPYMRGGKYGDDEKLKVIEAVEGGMSQADASRKFGISQGTISKWMAAWRSGNDGE